MWGSRDMPPATGEPGTCYAGATSRMAARGFTRWPMAPSAKSGALRERPGQPGGSRERERARRSFTGRDVLVIVLGIAAGLFIMWHIGHALSVRHYQPITCQLLGGHWDIWNGWRCG